KRGISEEGNQASEGGISEEGNKVRREGEIRAPAGHWEPGGPQRMVSAHPRPDRTPGSAGADGVGRPAGSPRPAAVRCEASRSAPGPRGGGGRGGGVTVRGPAARTGRLRHEL